MIKTRNLGLIFLFLITAFYCWSNLYAPIQRDGAHFVFMAKNIAFGQAPYWASFETKNPLVEIYWAIYLYFLKNVLDYSFIVRVAESAWVFITAYMLVKIPKKTSWHIFSYALLYIVLILDYRVSDFGLNISVYQNLPDLCLLFLLTHFNKSSFKRGVAVGALFFASWFIKQTGLLTTGSILLTYYLINRRDFRFKEFLTIIVVSASLVLVFIAHLFYTNTFDNYLLGSHTYKAQIIKLALPRVIDRAIEMFTLSMKDLNDILINSSKVTSVLMILTTVWSIITLVRNRDQNAKILISLSMVWTLSNWFQAAVGLTFFRHYFLVMILPVLYQLNLLFSFTRKPIRVFSTLFILIFGVSLIRDYRKAHRRITKIRNSSPIYINVEKVSKFIKDDDKVFNWSGLPQYLLNSNRKSDYPLNMIWPYIVVSAEEAEVTERLKTSMKPAPDIVLSVEEFYPENQGLSGRHITTEDLHEITGGNYELITETPRLEGRYGDSVKLFRKIDQ